MTFIQHALSRLFLLPGQLKTILWRSQRLEATRKTAMEDELHNVPHFVYKMCTSDNVQRISSLEQSRAAHDLNHQRRIHTAPLHTTYIYTMCGSTLSMHEWRKTRIVNGLIHFCTVCKSVESSITITFTTCVSFEVDIWLNGKPFSLSFGIVFSLKKHWACNIYKLQQYLWSKI